MNQSAMDGKQFQSFVQRIPGPRNCQNITLQSVLNDHVKIGTVTGIEVFESAGTMVIDVQVPSQQPENSKS